MEPPASAGSLRGWLLVGGMLFVSDGISSTPHAHMALQLAVAVEGVVRVHVGGRWHEEPGMLIDADVEHGFDTASPHAILHVDPDRRDGAGLRAHLLAGRPYVALSADEARAVGDEIASCLDGEAGCEEAAAAFDRAVKVLLGDRAEEVPPVDPRVRRVADALRDLDGPTPPIAALAAQVELSEGRLQHLFSEQMGMPISRYATWQRMMAAAGLMVEGASATEAAHGAGFADSAHMSRTFRRFNGQSPTSMGDLPALFRVCR